MAISHSRATSTNYWRASSSATVAESSTEISSPRTCSSTRRAPSKSPISAWPERLVFLCASTLTRWSLCGTERQRCCLDRRGTRLLWIFGVLDAYSPRWLTSRRCSGEIPRSISCTEFSGMFLFLDMIVYCCCHVLYI